MHPTFQVSELLEVTVKLTNSLTTSFDTNQAEKYYRHSPEERCKFSNAILIEIGVTSFHLLAFLLNGTFVSTTLWKEPSIAVKSLGMFDPIVYEHVMPMNDIG